MKNSFIRGTILKYDFGENIKKSIKIFIIKFLTLIFIIIMIVGNRLKIIPRY